MCFLSFFCSLDFGFVAVFEFWVWETRRIRCALCICDGFPSNNWARRFFLFRPENFTQHFKDLPHLFPAAVSPSAIPPPRLPCPPLPPPRGAPTTPPEAGGLAGRAAEPRLPRGVRRAEERGSRAGGGAEGDPCPRPLRGPPLPGGPPPGNVRHARTTTTQGGTPCRSTTALRLPSLDRHLLEFFF